ncbi:MAG: hypothetical protein ACU841_01255 [Gammaproteobacteria bacterium]
MANAKNFLSVCIVSAFALLSAASLPNTASANILPSAGALKLDHATGPGAGRFQEITRLQHVISAADTINQARELALAPTEGALGAVRQARRILPFSDDLRAAEFRLNDARSRILVAASREQIVDEFSGMMLAGLDDDSLARVNVGKVGCSYSTGETIAIVVGLILGIIPGLILLVVLC